MKEGARTKTYFYYFNVLNRWFGADLSLNHAVVLEVLYDLRPLIPLQFFPSEDIESRLLRRWLFDVRRRKDISKETAELELRNRARWNKSALRGQACMLWLRTKAADLSDVRQILSTADEPHAALAAKTLRRNLLTMKRWLLRIARTNTNTEINTLLTTSNYAYLAWKTCFVNFCQ